VVGQERACLSEERGDVRPAHEPGEGGVRLRDEERDDVWATHERERAMYGYVA
jgi:hypothetical protein